MDRKLSVIDLVTHVVGRISILGINVAYVIPSDEIRYLSLVRIEFTLEWIFRDYKWTLRPIFSQDYHNIFIDFIGAFYPLNHKFRSVKRLDTWFLW